MTLTKAHGTSRSKLKVYVPQKKPRNMKEIKIHHSQPPMTLEMIINHQYQHLSKSSSSGCYFFNINWFNLANTAGGLYWITTPNCDVSNSVEILKDLLRPSLTILEKLATSGASLTQTFEVDSGINYRFQCISKFQCW